MQNIHPVGCFCIEVTEMITQFYPKNVLILFPFFLVDSSWVIRIEIIVIMLLCKLEYFNERNNGDNQPVNMK